MSNRVPRAVIVVCVIAIALSGVSSYLVLNNVLVQQEQLRNLQNAVDEARSRISSLDSSLSILARKIAALDELALTNMTELQATVTELNASLSRLDDAFRLFLGKTPASIYESAHKSVVVIRTPAGQGSGFLYNSTNLILTNWHVVRSETDIDVQFYDGTRKKASVVGTDAYSDVAVIKVPTSPADAKPLLLADSSRLYIGEQVVAIGNPLGLTGSLSSGYISQINKLIDITDVPIVVPVLQLDITIAPGSSGGPLLDMSGAVVGITNAGTDYGFNFAVPSNIVKRVASSIMEKGYYRHAFVGFYGIELTPETINDLNILNLEPFQSGLLIWEVIADTPAAEAGLRGVTRTLDSQGRIAYTARDIILAVDDIQTFSFADWNAYVAEHVSPGQTINLTMWRSGEITQVKVSTTYRQPYSG